MEIYNFAFGNDYEDEDYLTEEEVAYYNSEDYLTEEEIALYNEEED